MEMFKENLKNIGAFVFDVDGVFTNGYIYVSSEGIQTRSMNVKDGYAVHFAAKKGIPIAIISGGKCNSIIHRFTDLGVEDIYIASQNKMVDYNHFIEKHNLNPHDILYMGDDLPDYQVMQRSGIKTCPADAAHEIKAICDYISPHKGGEGCVRDIIEQTLRAQKKWMDSDAFVW